MVQRRQLIIAVTAACISRSALAAAVDIDHTNRIVPVDQGLSNLCWLASAAMLMSATRGVPVTMAQLAGELGGMWKPMYDTKSAITADRVVPFAAALKVRTDGLKSMTADAWSSLLSPGPILLLGYSSNAQMGHAIVLSGLKGDTADFQGLSARVVDPNGGKAYTTSFKDLVAFYEGAALAGIPQLMYA